MLQLIFVLSSRDYVTGDPGSVIVPQYAVKLRCLHEVKKTILNFVGNTE